MEGSKSKKVCPRRKRIITKKEFLLYRVKEKCGSKDRNQFFKVIVNFKNPLLELLNNLSVNFVTNALKNYAKAALAPGATDNVN